MAEQAAHAGANEQETLSADGYLKLLKILKIKLPKGVLTPEVIAQSKRQNVIQDAEGIKQDLEKCELLIAPIPRLACGEIKQALQLKKEEHFQAITKMIFFKPTKLEQTSINKWEEQMKPGCGFRIRNTYRESPSQAAGGAAHNRFYGKYSEIQKNAMECFKFYLKQKELAEDDVNYKKHAKLEFGFLSGKPTFLVDIRRSREDISPEKVIVKCNSTTKDVEFNTSHPCYLQAQAFLFILKEKEKIGENPVPVGAVVVMKVKPSGEFYMQEVSDDTDKMEQLNNCCINEALPRFLAVLNLIFEKEN